MVTVSALRLDRRAQETTGGINRTGSSNSTTSIRDRKRNAPLGVHKLVQHPPRDVGRAARRVAIAVPRSSRGTLRIAQGDTIRVAGEERRGVQADAERERQWQYLPSVHLIPQQAPIRSHRDYSAASRRTRPSEKS
jgi:hypothetical protein